MTRLVSQLAMAGSGRAATAVATATVTKNAERGEGSCPGGGDTAVTERLYNAVRGGAVRWRVLELSCCACLAVLVLFRLSCVCLVAATSL